MNRVYKLALLVASLAVAGDAGSVAIDFEGLPDSTILTNQYAAQYGITFTNTAVINTLVFSSRISLNEFEFPPHSGSNVATDNGGPMTVRFAVPVAAVGGYFTYGQGGIQNFSKLTIRAFDANSNLVASISSPFANNEALSGDAGSSSNAFLQVAAAAGISYVIITGDPNGGSFALDDLTITPLPSGPAIISLTPSSGSQGQQNLSVAIAGRLTSWVQGTTTASFGAAITVKTLTITSAVTATAVLNVDPSAAAGPRTVTFTTGPEVAALASGFTVNVPADLTITKTHTGNFVQGQIGATYMITAKNIGIGATSGAVTVSDTVPAGVTPMAISGAGWTCPTGLLTTPVTCNRTDVLAPGASYPSITLTVNVANNAAAAVTNTAAVSGGGEVNSANDTATDITTISPAACVAPPAGVVSWWMGNGNTSDALGLNNPSASNALSFVSAKVGTGFVFGSGGYLDIPASPSLANQQFTWTAWARPDGPGPNNDSLGSVVLGQDIDSTHASVQILWRATDNRFLFVFGNNTSDLIISTDAFAAGQFYSVTGTYDGSTFKLFVNGALEGQFAAARTISYSALTWTIGSTDLTLRASSPRTWNGVIDEVQAFSRALTQTEIQAIYAADSAGECKAPPAISSFSPNTGQQGRQNLSVGITGQFTNWVQGTTTADFGAGVTVASLKVSSATSATATLNIDPAAATGARNVTLSTNTEVAALANGFTITTVMNLAPTVSAGANQTISLAVTDVGFAEYSGPAGAASFESGILLNEVTAGPDGNLWFTEGYEFGVPTQIGKMTPAGVITLYSVPSGSSEGGITVGSDGNLWFTEYRTGKVAKITTAGGITEFSIPSGTGSFPNAITAGADGNLWFTEVLANKIGQITPTGVFAEFPASNPVGITAGPDGNIWFTENTANKIGKLTPAGVLTEFPVPTSGSLPFKITAGPDGNLWFTEQAKIGRITPAGAITEFPVSTGGGQPAFIVKGSDGNLWFTVYGNTTNQIGRITTAGVITLYAEPTPSSRMGGITAGPGGNLWFVEASANKIASAAFGQFTTATTTLSGTVTDDGLPAGATLTATWSATSGPGAVTFGNPTATFPEVAGQVNPVITSATFTVPGTYVLGLAASDSLLSGSSSATVNINPVQVPVILSVTPNTGQQGQQNLSVNISGQFTNWVQGTTTASFGTGITVASLAIISPTSASAVLNVDPAAATGARNVTLTTGTEVVTLDYRLHRHCRHAGADTSEPQRRAPGAAERDCKSQRAVHPLGAGDDHGVARPGDQCCDANDQLGDLGHGRAEHRCGGSSRCAQRHRYQRRGSRDADQWLRGDQRDADADPGQPKHGTTGATELVGGADGPVHTLGPRNDGCHRSRNWTSSCRHRCVRWSACRSASGMDSRGWAGHAFQRSRDSLPAPTTSLSGSMRRHRIRWTDIEIGSATLFLLWRAPRSVTHGAWVLVRVPLRPWCRLRTCLTWPPH